MYDENYRCYFLRYKIFRFTLKQLNSKAHIGFISFLIDLIKRKKETFRRIHVFFYIKIEKKNYLRFHVVAFQYCNWPALIVHSKLQHHWLIGHVRLHFDQLISIIYPLSSDLPFEHVYMIHVNVHIYLAMQLNCLLIQHGDHFPVYMPLPLLSIANYFRPKLSLADWSQLYTGEHLHFAPEKYQQK